MCASLLAKVLNRSVHAKYPELTMARRTANVREGVNFFGFAVSTCVVDAQKVESDAILRDRSLLGVILLVH